MLADCNNFEKSESFSFKATNLQHVRLKMKSVNKKCDDVQFTKYNPSISRYFRNLSKFKVF